MSLLSHMACGHLGIWEAVGGGASAECCCLPGSVPTGSWPSRLLGTMVLADNAHVFAWGKRGGTPDSPAPAALALFFVRRWEWHISAPPMLAGRGQVLAQLRAVLGGEGGSSETKGCAHSCTGNRWQEGE